MKRCLVAFLTGNYSSLLTASIALGTRRASACGHAPLLTHCLCLVQVLEESKALVRCNMKVELEQANERECEVLKKIWGSAQGMDSMLKYLQRKIDEF